MNCACPKCTAPIEIDHSVIHENGVDRICDACKSRFWLYRESFGGRALKKRGEIFCASCGGELDRSIACPSCGKLYPDYVFAQATKAAPKRTVHVRSTYYIRRRPARKPVPHKTAAPKKPAGKFAIVNKYTISAALFAVLMVAGYAVYSHITAIKEYSAHYIRVLYGIKTGTDLCLQPFEKTTSSSADSFSQVNAAPTLSSKEQSRLTTVKVRVDALMKETESPPKKFLIAKKNLDNLYGTYAKMHALALQHSNSLQDYADSAEKLKNEFKNSSRELKSALPEQLSDELENARAKYRNLRDF